MTSGYPASRYSTLRRSPIRGAKKRAIEEVIDLRNATPEERRYALLRVQGASKERARRLATHPELGEIGAARKAQERVEESYYPTWEHVLFLHRLDFHHQKDSHRSKAGWPDYWIGGIGWEAYVELKARQVTGRAGRLSEPQKRYRESIELAGQEYRTFLFPDEWHEALVWLHSKTGREVWDVMLPDHIADAGKKVAG